jgi:hypothetical protein
VTSQTPPLGEEETSFQNKQSLAKKRNIVTDLINALPGNSSVNTVQHTTIDEAVFYVVRAEQRWNNGVVQPVSKQQFAKHTLA